jgi:adenosylhomocysteine nucleosidase
MTTDMTTLAVVPEAQESAPLLAALQAGGYSSSIRRIGLLDVACVDRLGLAVAVAGHGKVQLAVQTQHLLDLLPTVDTLLCLGAAGSLCEAAAWGDVIVGSCSIEHDYKLRFVAEPLPVHPADPGLGQEIVEAFTGPAAAFRVLCGPIASGDEDIVDAARASQLHAETGALCVAWEGAGAARAALFSGRAFAELRVITDVCDADAPVDFHASLETVLPHLAEVLVAWLERRGDLTSISS